MMKIQPPPPPQLTDPLTLPSPLQPAHATDQTEPKSVDATIPPPSMSSPSKVNNPPQPTNLHSTPYRLATSQPSNLSFHTPVNYAQAATFSTSLHSYSHSPPNYPQLSSSQPAPLRSMTLSGEHFSPAPPPPTQPQPKPKISRRAPLSRPVRKSSRQIHQV